MTAVFKSSTGTSVAEAVFNDIVTKNSRYYYYLGKILSWNPLGVDLPETPLNNLQYELATRSQIVYFKRIKESDVSFVIPRINWIMNTLYDMYDDSYSANFLSDTGASSLDTALFYVVTDESNVYKCIFNNNGSLSTVKPTGIDTSIFSTADGYQWKFMYNIPIGYRNKFFEATNIPVTTALRNQYYSKGQLSSIIINNPGSGYVQSTTSIVVTGDGYLAENPAIINNIIITEIGYGYTFVPAVSISIPTININPPIQATATVTIASTSVSSATITQVGYGYENNATITIAEPIATYVFWSANLPVNLGTIIKYNDVYYNVTIAGNLGDVAPTHLIGSASNGTATLTYTAKRAKAYINFSKTEASVSPVVDGFGQISGTIINNAGVGYTYLSISIAGVGTGASLSSNLSVGDLNTIQSNVELLAVNGSLSFIRVTNQGISYSAATVVITGDGTGAIATPIISYGKIVGITISNYGINYTYANAFIVGDGTGATLRVILAPNGGHGKNAILELNARTLMFFTTISSEKNQGILINNDNRQIGIVKTPKKFKSTNTFIKELGSTCYLLSIATNIDQTKFYPDGRLTTGQKEYYIVSVSGNSMIIASFKNDVPILGDILTNSTADNIVPTNIVPPDIDKYSGNLLFIDNRNAFTTTSEQSLSLRTTIQF